MITVLQRPWIRNKQTAVVLGLALVAAGFAVLYDAYDGRGGRKPAILGPFLPW